MKEATMSLMTTCCMSFSFHLFGWEFLSVFAFRLKAVMGVGLICILCSVPLMI